MSCEEARRLLLDEQRGRLPAGETARLGAHLEGCATCRGEDAAERALTETLARRLPRHAAPLSLKLRLEEQLVGAPVSDVRALPRAASLRARAAMPVAAAGLVLALAAGVAIYYEAAVIPRVQATAQLETEALNDHLRILYSEHPVEVESGGIHRVKPWFTGRLDFAPVVAFAGDDDFPLQGGAVSWFLDRKAAAFVFKRRLHAISLFVFRADGLTFPTSGLLPMGHARARAERLRGFNLLLWRDGELGYALVSDVDARDLEDLGKRLAP
jgi:anti-sigma factor RsiW